MTYKEFIHPFQDKDTSYINFINRRVSWELYQLDIYNNNYNDMILFYRYEEFENSDNDIVDDLLIE